MELHDLDIMGSQKLSSVSQGFYWGRRDVEEFCRRYDPCTAKKGLSGQSHAQQQQFVVGEAMERVAVGIMGPMPHSDRRNSFVFSATDYFTKWLEAYVVPDQEVETLANALVVVGVLAD